MLKKQLIFFLLLAITSSHSIFPMEALLQNRSLPEQIASLPGQTALHRELLRATKKGNACRVLDLLGYGARVNIRDDIGSTPLMRAARRGHEEICQILIEYKAEIDAKNLVGNTALIIAASHNHESICKLLINHGAQINNTNTFGSTTLMESADRGYASVCEVLIDNGAQIDAKNKRGHNALQIAVNRGRMSSIVTLIAAPIFNPVATEEEFRNSRQRILTALCIFKRVCPSLPKDIRKLILYRLPELKKDTINSGAFGLTEDQAPFVPLQLIQLLIKAGKLDPERAVAAIKAHHFACISPYCFEAIPSAQTTTIKQSIHPDNLEQIFDYQIEYHIRRRLGLLIWPEKIIHTWTEKFITLIGGCIRRFR